MRDFLQLALFVVGLVAITPPLGRFMARVFSGEPHFLSRLLSPLERGIYRNPPLLKLVAKKGDQGLEDVALAVEQAS